MRRQLARRVARWLGVYAAYQAFVLALTWPTVAQLTTHGVGGPDKGGRDHLWFVWWAKQVFWGDEASFGHITYLSSGIMWEKFGRHVRDEGKLLENVTARFEVESYLDHTAATHGMDRQRHDPQEIMEEEVTEEVTDQAKQRNKGTHSKMEATSVTPSGSMTR